MNLEDDLKKQGYNKEEEYFYKLNKALIEKARKRDKSIDIKAGEKAGRKKGGEMCPRCGSVLESVEPFGVRASRCRNCLGTFLAREALEFLLEAKEPQRFLSALLRPPEDAY